MKDNRRLRHRDVRQCATLRARRWDRAVHAAPIRVQSTGCATVIVIGSLIGSCTRTSTVWNNLIIGQVQHNQSTRELAIQRTDACDDQRHTTAATVRCRAGISSPCRATVEYFVAIEISTWKRVPSCPTGPLDSGGATQHKYLIACI